MSDFELSLFLIALSLSGLFLVQWFLPFYKIWPSSRIKFAKKYFVILPILSFIIIEITLNYYASFDVVSSGMYKLFYLVIGFAWIYVAMILVSFFLGLSWKDDIIHINNKAAMPPIAGAYIAVTLIYAGANIGDGPGWWCVIVASGLGLLVFLVLNFLIHKFTGVLENISIGRSKSAGIRMGMFFVACGIVLGRASGGDWVDFNQTVYDFWVAWPLLVLSIFVLIVEWICKYKEKKQDAIIISIFIGFFYIVFSIASLFIIPSLPENPIYGFIFGGFIL